MTDPLHCSYETYDEPSNEKSTTTESSATHLSRIPTLIIKATAVASIGGILFGYDLGVISSALPQLTAEFEMNQQQKQLVVSVLYLGGGSGAAIGGTFCDCIGRKRAILWTDVIFLIGALALSLARSMEMLVVGRIILGFAVAVSGVADVSYLTEIAPIEWRGAIVSVNEACISLGFLLAYLVGYSVDRIQPDHGWRIMFAFGGIMAVIQFVGMLFMPESPVWLEERNKEANHHQQQQQHQSYNKCGNRKQQWITDERHTSPFPSPIDNEQMQLAVNPTYISYTDPLEQQSSGNNMLMMVNMPASSPPSLSPTIEKSTTYSLLLSMYVAVGDTYNQFIHVISIYHRQVWVALFLSVTQQFCGQTPVLTYAPSIFDSAGLGVGEGSPSSLLPTVLVGFVKFFVTVLVIWKIEDLGRRFLLLTGMSSIVFGLILLAIAFHLGDDAVLDQNMNDEDDDDYFNSKVTQNEEAATSSSLGFALSLTGVICVVMGYSASFGPLSWLLTSEMFPTDIRGRALGASTIVTYLCASFVTSTFLSAQYYFGSSIVFCLFATITLSGVLFAYLAIPDTGEKNVQQIEEDLDSMWFWKKKTTTLIDQKDTNPDAVHVPSTHCTRDRVSLSRKPEIL
eukprot:CAMPEP_0195297076 /NCGR_PEP_ID=MMETSP0707-20130614/20774_1 /TAXON_ID=33640 /ORGANISM="Asterionellopsis glacialis, Strain CCMP134" /LENGTH=623 /DNA_ID=CAMNT_0040358771 /DNA_START=42 /DNA_END=1913 /DNA_ORIENTATION=+